MKPWRQVAVPHKDVLSGTFQQSEFAADISAVHQGIAGPEYGDAATFFERTFITEGMRLLLTQVAERLNGRGGEPVIQLQTAFGGGKTHTMLAVYHLAMRRCALRDLAGIPTLLDRAGLTDVPNARVAVLDGVALSPAQPWSHGSVQARTLWGELAYQLGGDEGYALVHQADETGTSPGKGTLRQLLERYAPCVILVDELLAYIRQFPDDKKLSGGTYDSNISFVQALTEATKLVPNAILLASLPESEIEAGSSRGQIALKSLEKIFGRVQSVWKPVATEEGFEIVRRRLFQPIQDVEERNRVCRAFVDAYRQEGSKLPSGVHEARYEERLIAAYPIHPEVFDRLYEDWSTLENFQRTRGVLKLMARVIHRLWVENNQDAMILPGTLPLFDSGTRNELVGYLAAGWDPVIESDIDGPRAEATQLDSHDPRFGQYFAARRVARTLFLATAPAYGGNHKAVRGIDRARVLLGSMQPGQPASTFSDALNRLADRLHYLNTSDDDLGKGTARFWFDTRANLRREMEDRKGRVERRKVREKLEYILTRLVTGSSLFEGTHIFTAHGDVPDDSALRLVFLPPDKPYSRQDPKAAFDAVLDIVRNNGSKPRYRQNRLIFVAADYASTSRLEDAVRTGLAWKSIVDDIQSGRLNIDRLQENQAKQSLDKQNSAIQQAVRDCYKWLLSPVLGAPGDRDIQIEVESFKTGGSTLASEIDRTCIDKELVLPTWAPIHLKTLLGKVYWKEPVNFARAADVWEHMQRHLYMARLQSRATLERTIVTGAGSRDYFATATGHEDGRYVGFKFGDANVQLDDTLLLVEPKHAAEYEERVRAAQQKERTKTDSIPPPPPSGDDRTVISDEGVVVRPPDPQPVISTPAAHHFYGEVEIKALTAKGTLLPICEEVIQLLTQDPTAKVQVRLLIEAEFPSGASETTRRAVSENATSLGFKIKTWK